MHSEQIRTTDIYPLPALEARSLKSRGMFRRKAPGENLSPASSSRRCQDSKSLGDHDPAYHTDCFPYGGSCAKPHSTSLTSQRFSSPHVVREGTALSGLRSHVRCLMDPDSESVSGTCSVAENGADRGRQQGQGRPRWEKYTCVYHPRNVSGSVSQESIPPRAATGPLLSEVINCVPGVS